MSNSNQRLQSTQKYQVWVTSWGEDGSGEATKAKAACSRYHAENRLVGQCDDIVEAVRIRDANTSYEPYITKLVTWQTSITDVTEAAQTGTSKE
jgi:hypothetical protein